jgi:hypothetical protein
MKKINTKKKCFKGCSGIFYDIALETHKGPPYIFYDTAPLVRICNPNKSPGGTS